MTRHALRGTVGALVLGLCGTSEVAGQTAAAWMARPEIREIREIYLEIVERLRTGDLTERVREFEYCKPSVTYRALATDANGVARRYVERGGSDDSAGEVQYYYDSAGRIRFVFAERGAVNGSELEEREYYGPQGDSLYVDRRIVKGVGYFWLDPEPVGDPLAAFDEPGECPEKRDRAA